MQTALSTGVRALPWVVLSVTIPVTAAKLVEAPSWSVPVLVGVAALAWLALCGWAFRRGPGFASAAMRVDAYYSQRGAAVAAWEILQRGSRRDGYAELLMDRLLETVDFRDRPSDVVPFQTPRSAPYGLLMVAALAALVVLQVSEPQVPPRQAAAVSPSPSSQSLLSQDDAELVRLESRSLQEDMSSEEGRERAEKFNQIIEQVVSGAMTEEEAFRALSALEEDLKNAEAQAERYLEGLERRGQALKNHDVTQEAGRAMQERRVADAEEALRRLAERLQDEKRPLSEREMQQLREALAESRKAREMEAKQKAGASEAEEHSRLEEKRDRLLKKKQQGRASQQELSELKETERRLKQLNRQKNSAREQLSELDKKLAEAARELARERKKAGQFMDQAARSLSRGAKRQLSPEEKKKLIEQLKKLKERLRKQNQKGDHGRRMKKFQKKARGKKSGEKGSGQQAGKPKLGPGGMPVPVPGQSAQGQKGQGQKGQKPASGREPGEGHDPNLQGQASDPLEAEARDKAAAARDTGEGQSASETILTAAERGFSSASYEKLYRDYETVAEEVVDSEEIPPGHKRHVQRYFELIRPRSSDKKAAK